MSNMDDITKNLIGSTKRDQFKRMHKEIGKEFWACDLDFVLVEKYPVPDIVAVLDYKDGEEITFSEVISYNALLHRGINIYIVDGDAKTGVFKIQRYVGGHHGRPDFRLIPECETKSWDEFKTWEQKIRDTWRKRYSPINKS